MVDVSQYTGLITSEHADMPKFNAMVSAVAQCFVDQQNALGSFIPSFDLDEAIGAQLDTLGAWVGIGRRVRTPLTGVYFSLDIAGVGFDQGVWQGPFDPSTGLTVLDDDTYRLLIRAKIGANHWDGTLASSAAILNLIFQGGTTPRHLTATNELFATGDGLTGAFQLTVGSIPVYSNISVASIYRSDWQGNQLLYSTARTNLIKQSGDISQAAWAKAAGIALSTDGTLQPDGVSLANLITLSSTTPNQLTQALSAPFAIGSTVTISWWVKPVGTPFSLQLAYYDSSISIASKGVTPVGNGWQRISATLTIGSTAVSPQIRLIGFTTPATGALYSGEIQVEAGGIVTSYIPTTTAAVTVTDYSVGATGLVAMGQKPVSGAQLTWNGSGDANPSGTQVFIEDHQDMSMSFGVAGKLPSALFLALLSGGYIPIKPEGVHVRDYVTTSVDGSPIFGFDVENGFISGLDVGAWGTPLN